MFFKINVLQNFTNFIGKHLCWCLFWIKLQAWRPANLLKRDFNTGVSCEVCETFKNTYFPILKNIWERLILFKANQTSFFQKQSPRGVPRKRCSKNMQQMQSNFIEITLRHGCSPVNLLHIFRTPFIKVTSGWLLLVFIESLWKVVLERCFS